MEQIRQFVRSKSANLQFVLQIKMLYRACRRGWSVKPNPKGHVLQYNLFHSAYIKG